MEHWAKNELNMFGATLAVACDASQWVMDFHISGPKFKTISWVHGQVSLSSRGILGGL